MKIRNLLLATAAIMACGSLASAATLYASRAAGSTGELYILNSATGAMVTDVGPLNDSGSVNYPVTGLAFHPSSGTLYGSTGNSVLATAATLVTINPATAVVTVVGPFNAGPVSGGGTPTTMGDIAFDSAGNLYGVATVGGPNLYSINTTTGQATLVGASGLASTSGGGLAISAASVFNGSPTSTSFGTYDSGTGAFTNIAAPTRPAGGGAYAALAYDGATLYGLNLGPGSPAPTHIVTIDPATAAVTDLGASVDQLDAIAFQASSSVDHWMLMK